MLENGLSSGLIAYSNTADASAITAHKGHWITITAKVHCSLNTKHYKGNRILLSFGQILMQTILAAIFFDFFKKYFNFLC